MKLNVAQLMKSPVGATRDYELEETFSEIEDQRISRPVSVQVHLTRINDGILAQGEVHTVIETPCSRCVEPAEQVIEYHFDEQFRPTIDISTGHPLKEDDDPGEPVYFIDANHNLDLDEMLREGIVIETPMHPLCSPGCKGLCGRCGTNLNLGPCQCEPDAPNGPMAAILKNLAPLVNKN